MSVSKKDIKDISELIRKKLELYMNVERRETRFDPRGRYTTTPMMHKYDFLYKVLDSSVLDSKNRSPRQDKVGQTRPKSSRQSPDRSKSAKRVAERPKSSLVRSSHSPRRDRRQNRRVISPGNEKRRKLEDSRSKSGSRKKDVPADRAGKSYPRPDTTMDESSVVSESVQTNASSSVHSRVSSNGIKPRLDDSPSRVVLHREKDRLSTYATKIFSEVPVDEIQLIHRYRPYYEDNGEPKYQGYSRHVGSILKSKNFVQFYNNEALQHSFEKENTDSREKIPPTKRTSKTVSRPIKGRQGTRGHDDVIRTAKSSRHTVFSSLIDTAGTGTRLVKTTSKEFATSSIESLTPTFTSSFHNIDTSTFPPSHDPYRPSETDRPTSPGERFRHGRSVSIASIKSTVTVNFNENKLEEKDRSVSFPIIKQSQEDQMANERASKKERKSKQAKQYTEYYEDPNTKVKVDREKSNVEITKHETIEKDKQLYNIKQIVVVSVDDKREEEVKNSHIEKQESIEHIVKNYNESPIETESIDQNEGSDRTLSPISDNELSETVELDEKRETVLIAEEMRTETDVKSREEKNVTIGDVQIMNAKRHGCLKPLRHSPSPELIKERKQKRKNVQDITHINKDEEQQDTISDNKNTSRVIVSVETDNVETITNTNGVFSETKQKEAKEKIDDNQKLDKDQIDPEQLENSEEYEDDFEDEALSEEHASPTSDSKANDGKDNSAIIQEPNIVPVTDENLTHDNKNESQITPISKNEVKDENTQDGNGHSLEVHITESKEENKPSGDRMDDQLSSSGTENENGPYPLIDDKKVGKIEDSIKTTDLNIHSGHHIQKEENEVNDEMKHVDDPHNYSKDNPVTEYEGESNIEDMNNKYDLNILSNANKNINQTPVTEREVSVKKTDEEFKQSNVDRKGLHISNSTINTLIISDTEYNPNCIKSTNASTQNGEAKSHNKVSFSENDHSKTESQCNLKTNENDSHSLQTQTISSQATQTSNSVQIQTITDMQTQTIQSTSTQTVTTTESQTEKQRKMSVSSVDSFAVVEYAQQNAFEIEMVDVATSPIPETLFLIAPKQSTPIVIDNYALKQIDSRVEKVFESEQIEIDIQKRSGETAPSNMKAIVENLESGANETKHIETSIPSDNEITESLQKEICKEGIEETSSQIEIETLQEKPVTDGPVDDKIVTTELKGQQLKKEEKNRNTAPKEFSTNKRDGNEIKEASLIEEKIGNIEEEYNDLDTKSDVRQVDRKQIIHNEDLDFTSHDNAGEQLVRDESKETVHGCVDKDKTLTEKVNESITPEYDRNIDETMGPVDENITKGDRTENVDLNLINEEIHDKAYSNTELSDKITLFRVGKDYVNACTKESTVLDPINEQQKSRSVEHIYDTEDVFHVKFDEAYTDEKSSVETESKNGDGIKMNETTEEVDMKSVSDSNLNELHVARKDSLPVTEGMCNQETHITQQDAEQAYLNNEGNSLKGEKSITDEGSGDAGCEDGLNTLGGERSNITTDVEVVESPAEHSLSEYDIQKNVKISEKVITQDSKSEHKLEISDDNLNTASKENYRETRISLEDKPKTRDKNIINERDSQNKKIVYLQANNVSDFSINDERVMTEVRKKHKTDVLVKTEIDLPEYCIKEFDIKVKKETLTEIAPATTFEESPIATKVSHREDRIVQDDGRDRSNTIEITSIEEPWIKKQTDNPQLHLLLSTERTRENEAKDMTEEIVGRNISEIVDQATVLKMMSDDQLVSKGENIIETDNIKDEEKDIVQENRNMKTEGMMNIAIREENSADGKVENEQTEGPVVDLKSTDTVITTEDKVYDRNERNNLESHRTQEIGKQVGEGVTANEEPIQTNEHVQVEMTTEEDCKREIEINEEISKMDMEKVENDSSIQMKDKIESNEKGDRILDQKPNTEEKQTTYDQKQENHELAVHEKMSIDQKTIFFEAKKILDKESEDKVMRTENSLLLPKDDSTCTSMGNGNERTNEMKQRDVLGFRSETENHLKRENEQSKDTQTVTPNQDATPAITNQTIVTAHTALKKDSEKVHILDSLKDELLTNYITDDIKSKSLEDKVVVEGEMIKDKTSEIDEENIIQGLDSTPDLSAEDETLVTKTEMENESEKVETNIQEHVTSQGINPSGYIITTQAQIQTEGNEVGTICKPNDKKVNLQQPNDLKDPVLDHKTLTPYGELDIEIKELEVIVKINDNRGLILDLDNSQGLIIEDQLFPKKPEGDTHTQEVKIVTPDQAILSNGTYDNITATNTLLETHGENAYKMNISNGDKTFNKEDDMKHLSLEKKNFTMKEESDIESRESEIIHKQIDNKGVIQGPENKQAFNTEEAITEVRKNFSDETIKINHEQDVSSDLSKENINRTHNALEAETGNADTIATSIHGKIIDQRSDERKDLKPDDKILTSKRELEMKQKESKFNPQPIDDKGDKQGQERGLGLGPEDGFLITNTEFTEINPDNKYGATPFTKQISIPEIPKEVEPSEDTFFDDKISTKETKITNADIVNASVVNSSQTSQAADPVTEHVQRTDETGENENEVRDNILTGNETLITESKIGDENVSVSEIEGQTEKLKIHEDETKEREMGDLEKVSSTVKKPDTQDAEITPHVRKQNTVTLINKDEDDNTSLQEVERKEYGDEKIKTKVIGDIETAVVQQQIYPDASSKNNTLSEIALTKGEIVFTDENKSQTVDTAEMNVGFVTEILSSDTVQNCKATDAFSKRNLETEAKGEHVEENYVEKASHSSLSDTEKEAEEKQESKEIASDKHFLSQGQGNASDPDTNIELSENLSHVQAEETAVQKQKEYAKNSASITQGILKAGEQEQKYVEKSTVHQKISLDNETASQEPVNVDPSDDNFCKAIVKDEIKQVVNLVEVNKTNKEINEMVGNKLHILELQISEDSELITNISENEIQFNSSKRDNDKANDNAIRETINQETEPNVCHKHEDVPPNDVSISMQESFQGKEYADKNDKVDISLFKENKIEMDSPQNEMETLETEIVSELKHDSKMKTTDEGMFIKRDGSREETVSFKTYSNVSEKREYEVKDSDGNSLKKLKYPSKESMLVNDLGNDDCSLIDANLQTGDKDNDINQNTLSPKKLDEVQAGNEVDLKTYDKLEDPKVKGNEDSENDQESAIKQEEKHKQENYVIQPPNIKDYIEAVIEKSIEEVNLQSRGSENCIEDNNESQDFDSKLPESIDSKKEEIAKDLDDENKQADQRDPKSAEKGDSSNDKTETYYSPANEPLDSLPAIMPSYLEDETIESNLLDGLVRKSEFENGNFEVKDLNEKYKLNEGSPVISTSLKTDGINISKLQQVLTQGDCITENEEGLYVERETLRDQNSFESNKTIGGLLSNEKEFESTYTQLTENKINNQESAVTIISEKKENRDSCPENKPKVTLANTGLQRSEERLSNNVNLVTTEEDISLGNTVFVEYSTSGGEKAFSQDIEDVQEGYEVEAYKENSGIENLTQKVISSKENNNFEGDSKTSDQLSQFSDKEIVHEVECSNNQADDTNNVYLEKDKISKTTIVEITQLPTDHQSEDYKTEEIDNFDKQGTEKSCKIKEIITGIEKEELIPGFIPSQRDNNSLIVPNDTPNQDVSIKSDDIVEAETYNRVTDESNGKNAVLETNPTETETRVNKFISELGSNSIAESEPLPSINKLSCDFSMDEQIVVKSETRIEIEQNENYQVVTEYGLEGYKQATYDLDMVMPHANSTSNEIEKELEIETKDVFENISELNVETTYEDMTQNQNASEVQEGDCQATLILRVTQDLDNQNKDCEHFEINTKKVDGHETPNQTESHRELSEDGFTYVQSSLEEINILPEEIINQIVQENHEKAVKFSPEENLQSHELLTNKTSNGMNISEEQTQSQDGTFDKLQQVYTENQLGNYILTNDQEGIMTDEAAKQNTTIDKLKQIQTENSEGITSMDSISEENTAITFVELQFDLEKTDGKDNKIEVQDRSQTNEYNATVLYNVQFDMTKSHSNEISKSETSEEIKEDSEHGKEIKDIESTLERTGRQPLDGTPTNVNQKIIQLEASVTIAMNTKLEHHNHDTEMLNLENKNSRDIEVCESLEYDKANTDDVVVKEVIEKNDIAETNYANSPDREGNVNLSGDTMDNKENETGTPEIIRKQKHEGKQYESDKSDIQQNDSSETHTSEEFLTRKQDDNKERLQESLFKSSLENKTNVAEECSEKVKIPVEIKSNGATEKEISEKHSSEIKISQTSENVTYNETKSPIYSSSESSDQRTSITSSEYFTVSQTDVTVETTTISTTLEENSTDVGQMPVEKDQQILLDKHSVVEQEENTPNVDIRKNEKNYSDFEKKSNLVDIEMSKSVIISTAEEEQTCNDSETPDSEPLTNVSQLTPSNEPNQSIINSEYEIQQDREYDYSEKPIFDTKVSKFEDPLGDNEGNCHQNSANGTENKNNFPCSEKIANKSPILKPDNALNFNDNSPGENISIKEENHLDCDSDNQDTSQGISEISNSYEKEKNEEEHMPLDKMTLDGGTVAYFGDQEEKVLKNFSMNKEIDATNHQPLSSISESDERESRSRNDTILISKMSPVSPEDHTLGCLESLPNQPLSRKITENEKLDTPSKTFDETEEISEKSQNTANLDDDQRIESYVEDLNTVDEITLGSSILMKESDKSDVTVDEKKIMKDRLSEKYQTTTDQLQISTQTLSREDDQEMLKELTPGAIDSQIETRHELTEANVVSIPETLENLTDKYNNMNEKDKEINNTQSGKVIETQNELTEITDIGENKCLQEVVNDGKISKSGVDASITFITQTAENLAENSGGNVMTGGMKESADIHVLTEQAKDTQITLKMTETSTLEENNRLAPEVVTEGKEIDVHEVSSFPKTLEIFTDDCKKSKENEKNHSEKQDDEIIETQNELKEKTNQKVDKINEISEVDDSIKPIIKTAETLTDQMLEVEEEKMHETLIKIFDKTNENDTEISDKHSMTIIEAQNELKENTEMEESTSSPDAVRENEISAEFADVSIISSSQTPQSLSNYPDKSDMPADERANTVRIVLTDKVRPTENKLEEKQTTNIEVNKCIATEVVSETKENAVLEESSIPKTLKPATTNYEKSNGNDKTQNETQGDQIIETHNGMTGSTKKRESSPEVGSTNVLNEVDIADPMIPISKTVETLTDNKEHDMLEVEEESANIHVLNEQATDKKSNSKETKPSRSSSSDVVNKTTEKDDNLEVTNVQKTNDIFTEDCQKTDENDKEISDKQCLRIVNTRNELKETTVTEEDTRSSEVVSENDISADCADISIISSTKPAQRIPDNSGESDVPTEEKETSVITVLTDKVTSSENKLKEKETTGNEVDKCSVTEVVGGTKESCVLEVPSIPKTLDIVKANYEKSNNNDKTDSKTQGNETTETKNELKYNTDVEQNNCSPELGSENNVKEIDADDSIASTAKASEKLTDPTEEHELSDGEKENVFKHELTNRTTDTLIKLNELETAGLEKNRYSSSEIVSETRENVVVKVTSIPKKLDNLTEKHETQFMSENKSDNADKENYQEGEINYDDERDTEGKTSGTEMVRSTTSVETESTNTKETVTLKVDASENVVENKEYELSISKTVNSENLEPTEKTVVELRSNDVTKSITEQSGIRSHAIEEIKDVQNSNLIISDKTCTEADKQVSSNIMLKAIEERMEEKDVQTRLEIENDKNIGIENFDISISNVRNSDNIETDGLSSKEKDIRTQNRVSARNNEKERESEPQGDLIVNVVESNGKQSSPEAENDANDKTIATDHAVQHSEESLKDQTTDTSSCNFDSECKVVEEDNRSSDKAMITPVKEEDLENNTEPVRNVIGKQVETITNDDNDLQFKATEEFDSSVDKMADQVAVREENDENETLNVTKIKEINAPSSMELSANSRDSKDTDETKSNSPSVVDPSLTQVTSESESTPRSTSDDTSYTDTFETLSDGQTTAESRNITSQTSGKTGSQHAKEITTAEPRRSSLSDLEELPLE